MVELDHVYVWTDVGAVAEADLLTSFGLVEGDPNTHPGQGTACRRFFFNNAYLELLWVTDSVEVQSDLVRPMRLWQRWLGRAAGASPFGVCCRPAGPGGGVPFPAWEYRPPYLPDPLVIHAGRDVPDAEPWWFYLAFARRPDDPGWKERQPLQHPAGLREVTGLRISGPGLDNPSAVAQAVAAAGVVTLSAAPDHLLELKFDAGSQGQRRDFRPVLPVVFRW